MSFFSVPYRTGKIWLVSLTAALVIYSLSGFLLLPWLIKTRTPALLNDTLHRKASLEQVSFNPFTLELDIDGFRLLEADRQTLFVSFRHLYLNYGLWQTIKYRGVGIQAIHLDGFYGHLDKTTGKTFNFSDLIDDESASPRLESSPPTLWLGDLQITDSQFLFEDHTLPTPYRQKLDRIDLSLQNLITLADGVTPYDLTLKLASGGAIHLQGVLTLTPLTATGTLTAETLNLPPLWEYFQPGMAFTLNNGHLSFGTDYRFAQQEKQTLNLQNAHLKLDKLSVTAKDNGHNQLTLANLAIAQSHVEISDNPQQPQTRLTLTTVRLDHLRISDNRQTDALIDIPQSVLRNLNLDVNNRQMRIAEFESNSAHIKSWLNQDGAFNWRQLFPADENANIAPATAAAKPFQIQIDSIRLKDYQLFIEDRRPKKPVKLALAQTNLTLKNFSNHPDKPFSLKLDSRINNQGRLFSQGSATLTPLNLALNIKARKLPVKLIQPYLSNFARLRIRRGELFVDGKLKLTEKQTVAGDFSGNIHIRHLRTTDTLQGQDFLNWQTLSLTGLHYHFAPPSLDLEQILADRLYSRIRVEKDKSTNIGKIFLGPVQHKKKTTTQKPLPVHIGQVIIKNAAANFSDFSLILPFTLEMDHLQGKIRHIDSRRHQQANVSLTGKINQLSKVSIAGGLNPFDIKAFMSIQLKTDSVDLTTITPYMAQFAGYEVEKGKISLDLNYRIVNKKLQAENRIIIDQLTLGREIESPDAVSLPIKLGIALLKDANGVIDLDLPLEGSLDDPQFSLTSLIGKVLYNLLEKAISSPFSLLGKLIGANDDLSQITFMPGQARLTEEQRQRLDKISAALKARPALKLEITGLALEKTDRRGLQRQQLWAQIQALQHDQPDDDATNRPSKPSDRIIQHYLPDILAQRFPDMDLPDTLESDDGHDILPPAFVESIWERLLDSYPVTDLNLRQLAEKRANTIAHYLIDQTHLPQQRIFILNAVVKPENRAQPTTIINVPLSLTTQ